MLRNSSRYWWLVWAMLGGAVFCAGAWGTWSGTRRYAATTSFNVDAIHLPYFLTSATIQGIADVQAQRHGAIAQVEPSAFPVGGRKIMPPSVFSPLPTNSKKAFTLTASGETPAAAAAAANSILQATGDMSRQRLVTRVIMEESRFLESLPPAERARQQRMLESTDPVWMDREWRPLENMVQARAEAAYRLAECWGIFSMSSFVAVTLTGTLVAALSHRLSSRLLALRPL